MAKSNVQRELQYDTTDSDVIAESVVSSMDMTVTPLAREHLAKQHRHLTGECVQNNSQHISTENQATSLAVEAAVAIVINGIHYAVLMASPSQLEYLAIGFLFSEGLIEHSHELLDWEVTQLTDLASFEKFANDTMDNQDKNAEPMSFNKLDHLLDYDIYIVELVLNQRCYQRIQAQKRQLAGRTGCGMCGITGLRQALPDLSNYLNNKSQMTAQNAVPNIQSSIFKIPSLDSLLAIRAQMDRAQHTHQLTGAVHAAATMQGDTLHLFEDVGRHNALDKLIGWQLRHKVEVDCVVMTSRLSIELVQKSIRMRLPWLIGMSAPTSTAVRVAERYGLGLAGFLRDNRVTFYTGYTKNTDC